MWHAFRRATRDRVARGGDPHAMLAAAISTFRSLAEWCGQQPFPRKWHLREPTTAATPRAERTTPGPAR